MKRSIAVGVAVGAFVLGPAALAQAGEQHHRDHRHGAAGAARASGSPSRGQGHRAPCRCHKPRPRPSCKPNCQGRGDQGHKPRKPVCHKPHPRPAPPCHHRPHHHHHPRPPHKPPVTPPVKPIPHPPVVKHPVKSHVSGHKRTHATTAAPQPTGQLAYTGPADYWIYAPAAVLLIVIGGAVVYAGRKRP